MDGYDGYKVQFAIVSVCATPDNIICGNCLT